MTLKYLLKINCLLVISWDNLNEINNRYGSKKGDKVFYELVILINKYLKSKGIKYTKQGTRKYETTFSEVDGTYKNSSSLSTVNNDDETDVYAWENGFISISPLVVNRSHTEYLSMLKKRG